jgi:hypothetical protein
VEAAVRSNAMPTQTGGFFALIVVLHAY